jgi:hypothetical protein
MDEMLEHCRAMMQAMTGADGSERRREPAGCATGK